MAKNNLLYYCDLFGISRDDILIRFTFDNPQSGIISNDVDNIYFGGGFLRKQNPYFWSSSGSGFFNCGTNIDIPAINYLEQDKDRWTMLFITDKIYRNSYNNTYQTNEILFSNQKNGSGFTIGLTANGNMFFDYNCTGSVFSGRAFWCGEKSYSKRQIHYIIKNNNYISLGGFDSGSLEFSGESFNLLDQLAPSNCWKLCSGHETGVGGFEGYMDEFLFLKETLDLSNLSLIVSGYYADEISYFYTGISGFTTGITRYEDITGYNSGITGYSTSFSGFEYDDCNNPIPVYTNIEQTGLIPYIIKSGVTGFIYYQNRYLTGIVSGIDYNFLSGIEGGDSILGSIILNSGNTVYNSENTYFNLF